MFKTMVAYWIAAKQEIVALHGMNGQGRPLEAMEGADKLNVPHQETSLLGHVSYKVEDGSLLILPLEVDGEICLEHSL